MIYLSEILLSLSNFFVNIIINEDVLKKYRQVSAKLMTFNILI